MKVKPTVDTPFAGSWADEEFKRNHKTIVHTSFMGRKTVTYEKIHRPLPDWWGKQVLIGPLANSISLYPV